MNVTSKLGTAAQKAAISIKEASPTIKLVGGIILVVGAVVGVAVQTKKTLDIVDDSKEELETIDNSTQESENLATVIISDTEARKEQVKIYIRTGLKIAKVYILPAGMLILGIILICSGHVELSKRNAQLTAACAAIAASASKFEDNVRNQFGEETYKELKYGVHQEEITEKDENGNETKKSVAVVDNSSVKSRPFAFYFDDHNDNYRSNGVPGKDGNYIPPMRINRNFLECKEKEWNIMLHNNHERYIWANDVLKDLGYEPIAEFHNAGWICTADHPMDIEFNITEVYRQVSGDIVPTYEKVLIIELNPCMDIRNFVYGDEERLAA